MVGWPENFMRPIERIKSAKQIAEILHNTMSPDDVNTLFRRMGKKRPTMPSAYTLRSLITAYLGEVSDNELLEIAKYLGLTDENVQPAVESKYWQFDHFRVFISHVHGAKKSAGNLRAALKGYAISAFVAHDDIAPSHEWEEEILTALNSMDALAAILTPDFNASKWTNQEVGVAVAKSALIIPINKGQNPMALFRDIKRSMQLGLQLKM